MKEFIPITPNFLVELEVFKFKNLPLSWAKVGKGNRVSSFGKPKKKVILPLYWSDANLSSITSPQTPLGPGASHEPKKQDQFEIKSSSYTKQAS